MGWDGTPLSEWLGLPRIGGRACERATAGIGRWRIDADQRDDIAATVAADEGAFDHVARMLDRIERDLAYWTVRVGTAPGAEERVAALTARAGWCRTLLARPRLPVDKTSW